MIVNALEQTLQTVGEWLRCSFDLSIVLSSVRGFLGSGYVGIAAFTFLCYCLACKLAKLLVVAFVIVVVYLVISSGNFFSIMQEVNARFAH